MGLPLFVAPVESDLPHKAAAKTDTTSPSRSAIRRPTHVSRDRRSRREARFQSAVARAGINGGPTARDPSHARIPDSLREMEARWSDRARNARAQREGVDSPWHVRIESWAQRDAQRGGASDTESRPFREALREMSRTDEQQRARMEEQVHALFTHPARTQTQQAILRRSREHAREDLVADLVAMGARPPPRHARIARDAPVVHRFDRSPEGDDPRPSTTQSPLPSQPAHTLPAINEGQLSGAEIEMDGMGQTRRSLLDQDIENMLAARRSLLDIRARALDGLGDRNRSISPEVWDTLLTTLTPDPQPPSASSSFASAAASHSAAPSSNTTPPASNPPEETMADAGCENSDVDEPDFEDAMYERLRRRRRGPERIPPRYTDRPSYTDRLAHLRSPRTTQASSGDGNAEVNSSAVSTTEGDNAVRSPALASGETLELLVDDELIQPRLRNRDGSTQPVSRQTSAGDEDWLGMQRIMRSMAAREDIPDEWWAEAGLSRTLPRDGTD